MANLQIEKLTNLTNSQEDQIERLKMVESEVKSLPMADLDIAEADPEIAALI